MKSHDQLESEACAANCRELAHHYQTEPGTHPVILTLFRAASLLDGGQTKATLAEEITRLVEQHSGADVARALGEEFNRRFWLGSGHTLIDLAYDMSRHPDEVARGVQMD